MWSCRLISPSTAFFGQQLHEPSGCVPVLPQQRRATRMHLKGLCGLGTVGILWDLDVSMDDASAVQVRQPLEHLLHDGSYLHFSQALQVYTNASVGVLRGHRCPRSIDGIAWQRPPTADGLSSCPSPGPLGCTHHVLHKEGITGAPTCWWPLCRRLSREPPFTRGTIIQRSLPSTKAASSLRMWGCRWRFMMTASWITVSWTCGQNSLGRNTQAWHWWLHCVVDWLGSDGSSAQAEQCFRWESGIHTKRWQIYLYWVSDGIHVQPTILAPSASRSTFFTATSWPVDLTVALYTCGMRHAQSWYTLMTQAG